MTYTRGITLSAHGAIEMIVAPLVMVAPFVLGFGPVATVVAVAFGAILIGLALQVSSPTRSLPLSAHASFEYMLAVVALGAGIGLAIAGAASEAVFLVGVGAAQVGLTAMTRFSTPRHA